MNKVETFTGTIYCGFCEGYNKDYNPQDNFVKLQLEKAKGICRAYCDVIGLCVTVEPTYFIYTNGQEDGVKVGFINYPRFPKEIKDIKDEAIELAKHLKAAFSQKRVSIVFTDETIMIGELE